MAKIFKIGTMNRIRTVLTAMTLFEKVMEVTEEVMEWKLF